ncbi:MAG TPA: helix-turn-helix transcriptional regulator [Allosphingosinicella sp.]|jgi:DNA-binding transcriptional ArsR family regulator|nr:helix-turn-helix transcriptional regulator [Allosphingosinicella sp.]
MTNIASLAANAALIADPSRAAMLVALMDGRALTAGELAGTAGVTPPTASGHLARLTEAGLVAAERQGRHIYYRLASPAVGATIEALMAATAAIRPATPPKPVRVGPRDQALRFARTCYNHLAGTVAVAMADAMVERGLLDRSEDGAALTEAGIVFLRGLDVALEPRGGPAFCRLCLDWSERRHHLAGKVGAALCRTFLDRHWARPMAESRAVALTSKGAEALHRHFGLRLDGARA